jgi:uncharacterized membrane protein YphA (DoxX/SURF4 family)
MKHSISISRVIVGVLFIFSGLIKADDPLGLSYKMQEFFEIWGWNRLDDYALAFSVGMIAFEIIAGVAVLLGWRMNVFSWLLLLLTIFFTFLTGYALFSGKVRECGCFGDCIPLTAQQSFIKDLVLLVLIVLIFISRHAIRSYWPARTSMTVLLCAVVFAFGFQWYVLRHLPVIDCLPYRQGKNISQQMMIPKGAIPDSTVITFVYRKQGKEVEFTADNFPTDFDESTYQFVKRYDKLVRKGNAETAIKDFALGTASGNDTTQAVLQTPGYSILVFTKGIAEARPGWTEELKHIFNDARKKQVPLYFITNDFNNVTAWAGNAGLAGYAPVLMCDYVAIKTAARANPTLYLLQQGTITGKWSWADFNQASRSIGALPARSPAAVHP